MQPFAGGRRGPAWDLSVSSFQHIVLLFGNTRHVRILLLLQLFAIVLLGGGGRQLFATTPWLTITTIICFSGVHLNRPFAPLALDSEPDTTLFHRHRIIVRRSRITQWTDGVTIGTDQEFGRVHDHQGQRTGKASRDGKVTRLDSLPSFLRSLVGNKQIGSDFHDGLAAVLTSIAIIAGGDRRRRDTRRRHHLGGLDLWASWGLSFLGAAFSVVHENRSRIQSGLAAIAIATIVVGVGLLLGTQSPLQLLLLEALMMMATAAASPDKGRRSSSIK